MSKRGKSINMDDENAKWIEKESKELNISSSKFVDDLIRDSREIKTHNSYKLLGEKIGNLLSKRQIIDMEIDSIEDRMAELRLQERENQRIKTENALKERENIEIIKKEEDNKLIEMMEKETDLCNEFLSQNPDQFRNKDCMELWIDKFRAKSIRIGRTQLEDYVNAKTNQKVNRNPNNTD